MDYGTLIEKRKARLTEIEKLMEDPGFFNDQRNSTQYMREHRSLKKLMGLWDEFQQVTNDIEGNEELAKGDDEEFSAMAEEELPALRERHEVLAQEVQYALLPKDETEDRDALIEIRAGAGGDEASLFAGELMNLSNATPRSGAGNVSTLKVLLPTLAVIKRWFSKSPVKKFSAT